MKRRHTRLRLALSLDDTICLRAALFCEIVGWYTHTRTERRAVYYSFGFILLFIIALRGIQKGWVGSAKGRDPSLDRADGTIFYLKAMLVALCGQNV